MDPRSEKKPPLVFFFILHILPREERVYAIQTPDGRWEIPSWAVPLAQLQKPVRLGGSILTAILNALLRRVLPGLQEPIRIALSGGNSFELAAAMKVLKDLRLYDMNDPTEDKNCATWFVPFLQTVAFVFVCLWELDPETRKIRREDPKFWCPQLNPQLTPGDWVPTNSIGSEQQRFLVHSIQECLKELDHKYPNERA